MLVAVAALLAGCASGAARPTGYARGDALQSLVASAGATDARFEPVADRPWLQVDLALRYLAQDYPEQAPARERERFIADFLRQAETRGRAAMTESLERIEPQALADYAAHQGIAVDGDVRADVEQAYGARSRAALAAELARVSGLDDSGLNDYWTALTAAIQPSILTRGRLTRRLATAPAVPFIEGWIAYHNRHDYRGPVAPDFAKEETFVPGGLSADMRDVDAYHLLQRYAPVIVQEHAAHPDYPDDWDRFGSVALNGTTLATAQPAVDGAHPALYGFVQYKPIQGQLRRQLVYVLWYPQHPALSRFDPEAGPLDGWTLRVTLDADERPLVVESVSNCGCYYKVFPSEKLETLSAEQWPATLPGKAFHIEQHLSDRVDAVVPELVPGLADPERRLVAYFSAGHHQLVTLRSVAAREIDAATATPYVLHAYDELERLPFGTRRASLFAPDGLVRAAHRSECSLLTPSGLYHAGHPRQRETQMIYFDEADFDDPALLEHYLRLPPDAFGPHS